MSSKNLPVKWGVICLGLALGLTSLAFGQQQTTTQGTVAAAAPAPAPAPAPEPGVYDLVGWNTGSPDINGEVGRPLLVKGPTARCEPGRTWTGNARIISAAWPMGISMSGTKDIWGTPTEPGNSTIEVQLDSVNCNGQSYPGLQQQLRFHISGSGKAVDVDPGQAINKK